MNSSAWSTGAPRFARDCTVFACPRQAAIWIGDQPSKLEPEGAGTRLCYRAGCEVAKMNLFFKMLMPLFTLFAKVQLKGMFRRLKAAAFRESRSLDSFDFSFNSSVDRKQVYALATGRFVEEPRDVLLIGPPGVGKSHLAQAIGAEVAKSGKSVLYRSIFDVVAELLEDDLAERHHKIMTRYLKCDLLIIDDMGIKQLPPKSGEYLFEIVMRRYEVRATMMTSNRPLEEWGKLIGDVPAATAILDRFLHHAKVIKISGRSYRLRNQACAKETENP